MTDCCNMLRWERDEQAKGQAALQTKKKDFTKPEVFFYSQHSFFFLSALPPYLQSTLPNKRHCYRLTYGHIIYVVFLQ